VRARAVLAAMLLMSGAAAAAARITIYDDRGGQIGAYLAKYEVLRQSGQQVEIDGLCASACTMLLGAIPQNRICVTPRAVLEFHSAWNPAPSGGEMISDAGNRILWSRYPAKIRRWIKRHGGLKSRTIDLSGPELSALYPACR
jgi:hypothetical protein